MERATGPSPWRAKINAAVEPRAGPCNKDRTSWIFSWGTKHLLMNSGRIQRINWPSGYLSIFLIPNIRTCSINRDPWILSLCLLVYTNSHNLRLSTYNLSLYLKYMLFILSILSCCTFRIGLWSENDVGKIISKKNFHVETVKKWINLPVFFSQQNPFLSVNHHPTILFANNPKKEGNHLLNFKKKRQRCVIIMLPFECTQTYNKKSIYKML